MVRRGQKHCHTGKINKTRQIYFDTHKKPKVGPTNKHEIDFESTLAHSSYLKNRNSNNMLDENNPGDHIASRVQVSTRNILQNSLIHTSYI